jgi:hypothetical protein
LADVGRGRLKRENFDASTCAPAVRRLGDLGCCGRLRFGSSCRGCAARNTTSTDNTTAGNAAANTAGDPAVTGSVASGQTGIVNPSRIVLRQMTKADLENAPNFNRMGVATGSATTPTNGANAPTNQ